MATKQTVTTQQINERLQDAVKKAEALSQVLQRKQERVTKTTQTDKPSLEVSVEFVRYGDSYDWYVAEQSQKGWELQKEEPHDQSMAKITFVRPKDFVVTKSAQTDGASLKEIVWNSKLNQQMMQPEQEVDEVTAQTILSELEFDSEVVHRDSQREPTIFKRLRQGWVVIGEETYGPNPALTNLKFARKKAQ